MNSMTYTISQIAKETNIPVERLSALPARRIEALDQAILNAKRANFKLKQEIILASAGKNAWQITESML